MHKHTRMHPYTYTELYLSIHVFIYRSFFTFDWSILTLSSPWISEPSTKTLPSQRPLHSPSSLCPVQRKSALSVAPSPSQFLAFNLVLSTSEASMPFLGIGISLGRPVPVSLSFSLGRRTEYLRDTLARPPLLSMGRLFPT